jgi:hypothetical protein
MTFGTRLTPQLAAPSGQAADVDIPTPTMRWAVIAALSAVAVVATLYVWFNVFKIPLEFPAPSLFAAPRGGAPSARPYRRRPIRTSCWCKASSTPSIQAIAGAAS